MLRALVILPLSIRDSGSLSGDSRCFVVTSHDLSVMRKINDLEKIKARNISE
jgi:hypothetical protein